MPDTMITAGAPVAALRGTITPSSWDPEARTVEVVFTTGAPVTRTDWMTGRPFIEVLQVSEAAVDLSRLNAGAPVLNTHSSWSLTDQIGVVEQAWIQGNEGRARLRLSSREDVAPIVQDIADGIIRNVSAGYWITDSVVTPATNSSPEIRTAVRWTPGEISFVPVPADAGAQTRGAPLSNSLPQPQQAPEALEARMPETPTVDQGAAPAAPAVDAAAAVAAERARIADITTIARQAQMDQGWTQRAIETGMAVDAARAQALDAVEQRATPRIPAEVAGARQDATETQWRLMENALQHRGLVSGVVLEEGARQYRGFELIDFARTALEFNGVKTRGMSRPEIARAALSQRSVSGLSTSDFPGLLANTASKSLRAGYVLAPRTFLQWCTEMNLPDFKTFRTVSLSGAPQLAPILENGEVTYGKIGDGSETWNLSRFGRAVAINYVAIINDDMSGFTRIPAMFGAEAGALENATVWSIVTANATLADGGALFNATAVTSAGGHANLISGGGTALTNDATGIAQVGGLRKMMRLQRAPTVDGVAGRLLNLDGRFLAVPAALEHVALSLFSNSVVPAATGAANPYRSVYEIITEPLLDAASTTAFFLFAEPTRVDTIHYGYLEGESGPVITSDTDFDTDGVKIKCMHNFGAKAIDFRGMAKSAGA